MKKTYLIILLIFLILLIAIYWIFFTNKQIDNQKSSPASSSTPNLIESTEKLKLVSVSPPNNSSEGYFPIQQVAFSFNKKIVPQSLDYSVSPESPTKTYLSDDKPNTVIIMTTDIWKEGITEIVIRGVNDILLEESYVYRLKTAFPKNPDIQE